VGDQSYSVAGCPLENLSMRICEIAQWLCQFQSTITFFMSWAPDTLMLCMQ
jgi:hypothetical protein